MNRFLVNWRMIARIALALFLVAGLAAVIVWRDGIDAARIIAWAGSQALWESALLFLFLHVVASLFFIPRLILGAAAGALFGVWSGTALALLGATLGGLVGLWVVRLLSSDAVRLEELPRFGKWIEKAESHGWKFVMIVRLVPVFPHSLVNYVLGLSQVSTWGYAVGSALGMVPTAFVFVNLGATGRSILEGSQDYALLAVWGLGLLFVSWLLPKLMKRVFPGL